MNLGPYFAFILGAYAIAFATIGALVVWVTLDYRMQKRTLDDFELRGVVRRSERRSHEPAVS
jgi:heme exporter protein CcmD